MKPVTIVEYKGKRFLVYSEQGDYFTLCEGELYAPENLQNVLKKDVKILY